MSPKERDDNQGLVDAEQDGPKPDAVEPAGTAGAPDVPAPAEMAEPAPADVAEPGPAERKIERTRASGWWAGLIIAAIVLIFLLIFILQNVESVDIEFLMFSGSLPLGVAMLLAAIAGILVVAIPGVARMIQLRRHHKH
jgi:uncharacterized integral membrane protein